MHSLAKGIPTPQQFSQLQTSIYLVLMAICFFVFFVFCSLRQVLYGGKASPQHDGAPTMCHNGSDVVSTSGAEKKTSQFTSVGRSSNQKYSINVFLTKVLFINWSYPDKNTTEID